MSIAQGGARSGFPPARARVPPPVVVLPALCAAARADDLVTLDTTASSTWVLGASAPQGLAASNALLAELVTQIDAVANPWLVGKGDPEVALRESLRGLVQVGVEHGGILRAVAEAAPFDPRLERAWSTFMAHWDDAVCARIEAQQAQGLIPPFDARAMASALNRLDAAILIQAFGHRRPADPEGVLDTLHRIWASSLYGPSRKSRTGRRPRPSP